MSEKFDKKAHTKTAELEYLADNMKLQALVIKSIQEFNGFKDLVELVNKESVYDGFIKPLAMNVLTKHDLKEFSAHGLTVSKVPNRTQYGTNKLTAEQLDRLNAFLNSDDKYGLMIANVKMEELRKLHPDIADCLTENKKDVGSYIRVDNHTGYATMKMEAIKCAINDGRPVSEVVGWSINTLGDIIRVGLKEDESQRVNAIALLRAMADELEEAGAGSDCQPNTIRDYAIKDFEEGDPGVYRGVCGGHRFFVNQMHLSGESWYTAYMELSEDEYEKFRVNPFFEETWGYPHEFPPIFKTDVKDGYKALGWDYNHYEQENTTLRDVLDDVQGFVRFMQERN